MAPPENVLLTVGDTVQVIWPENPDMHGIIGILKKEVSRDRWSLKVEGEDRTRLVKREHLDKFAPQASARPDEKYCITGTWDEWESNEMEWNQEANCFEYTVTIGTSGVESFRILVDGDWDKCIYPDCSNATMHEPHTVKGPDDPANDHDWTIGAHKADEAAVGATYRVRLVIAENGQPQKVSWEMLGGGKSAARQSPKGLKAPAAAVAPAAKRVEATPGGMPPAWLPRDATEPELPKQLGGQNVSNWVTGLTGDDIVAIERAASERLAQRLEEAAQVNMLALRDEDDPGLPERLQITLKREEEERSFQKVANLQRYKRSVEESTEQVEMMAKKEVEDGGPCAECGETTTHTVGGQYCCEACLQAWEELREDGWDGSLLCGGVPAGRRAQIVMLEAGGRLNTMEARRQVMRDYAPSFRPGQHGLGHVYGCF
mmetsp:Transcript_99522/g.276990  ORF Transcript_99522/g.276990 Transcript_99522/m.276990 type:complete len:431 (+) Transcript_99522:87-1379(+)